MDRIAPPFPIRKSIDVSLFLATVALIVWGLVQGAEAMGYNWQWYRIPRYFGRWFEGEFYPGPLLKGLWTTIEICSIAFLLCIAIGLAAAILRMADTVVGRAIAGTYIELIRNTPILVQLYLFYYVLGPIFDLDRYWASILCLAVFEGAFAAEIFRAGIASVPKGQREAAQSVGLSSFRTYTDIILPQATRMMLPPFVNLAVSVVKHSAIVSVIAVAELTTKGRDIISETYMSFEVWFTVAALYLVITTALSVGAGQLERRFAIVER